MRLVFLLSIMATSVLAVSLEDASNRQLLDELASRLFSGNSGQARYNIQAGCSNNYFSLRTYDRDFNLLPGHLRVYEGSNCASTLKALPFGGNVQIKVGASFAVCFNNYYTVYGITGDGSLKQVKRNYEGPSCPSMRDAFNSSFEL